MDTIKCLNLHINKKYIESVLSENNGNLLKKVKHYF